MDSKFTTITINKELSKRIRLLALHNGVKTQKVLELMCDVFEEKEQKKIDKLPISK